MRFHDFHWRWLIGDEFACVVGIAGGRVRYEPIARHLYSVRLMLFFVKLEILFTAGKPLEAA